MAWEARSGLKQLLCRRCSAFIYRLNGLGSPFGIETFQFNHHFRKEQRGLNGLGSPFGIETSLQCGVSTWL